MRAVRATCWLVVVLTLVIVLVLVGKKARGPTPFRGAWVLLSKPIVASPSNAGVATPVVSVGVSNVGPRSIEFVVSWFECRARGDRTLLATNRLSGISIPLRSGRSTNLTMDFSLAATPVEDCLCCFQVCWWRRESPVRLYADRLGHGWFGLFGLDWHSPWRSEHLVAGDAFGANVEVAEYFRLMYGFTRAQWLEENARYASARTQVASVPVVRYARGLPPSADDMVRLAARGAFITFCQATNAPARNAELTAPPNAAPPHR